MKEIILQKFLRINCIDSRLILTFYQGLLLPFSRRTSRDQGCMSFLLRKELRSDFFLRFRGPHFGDGGQMGVNEVDFGAVGF